VTRFADKDFASRLGALGDEAESVFEEVYPKGWAVYGLRRPPIRVAALAPKIRFSPDYITSDGFIEVASVFTERVLKLKVAKHIALLQWNQEMPTYLFIWDSPENRYTLPPMTIEQVTDAVAAASVDHFPEGTPYWAIPVEELDAEWAQRSSP